MDEENMTPEYIALTQMLVGHNQRCQELIARRNAGENVTEELKRAKREVINALSADGFASALPEDVQEFLAPQTKKMRGHLTVSLFDHLPSDTRQQKIDYLNSLQTNDEFFVEYSKTFSYAAAELFYGEDNVPGVKAVVAPAKRDIDAIVNRLGRAVERYLTNNPPPLGLFAKFSPSAKAKRVADKVAEFKARLRTFALSGAATEFSDNLFSRTLSGLGELEDGDTPSEGIPKNIARAVIGAGMAKGSSIELDKVDSEFENFLGEFLCGNAASRRLRRDIFKGADEVRAYQLGWTLKVNPHLMNVCDIDNFEETIRDCGNLQDAFDRSQQVHQGHATAEDLFQSDDQLKKNQERTRFSNEDVKEQGKKKEKPKKEKKKTPPGWKDVNWRAMFTLFQAVRDVCHTLFPQTDRGGLAMKMLAASNESDRIMNKDLPDEIEPEDLLDQFSVEYSHAKELHATMTNVTAPAVPDPRAASVVEPFMNGLMRLTQELRAGNKSVNEIYSEYEELKWNASGAQTELSDATGRYETVYPANALPQLNKSFEDVRAARIQSLVNPANRDYNGMEIQLAFEVPQTEAEATALGMTQWSDRILDALATQHADAMAGDNDARERLNANTVAISKKQLEYDINERMIDASTRTV